MNNKTIYGAIALLIVVLAVILIVFANSRGKESEEKTLDSSNIADSPYTPDTSNLNPAEKANPFKKVKTNPFE